jgi:hypothetical protein
MLSRRREQRGVENWSDLPSKKGKALKKGNLEGDPRRRKREGKEECSVISERTRQRRESAEKEEETRCPEQRGNNEEKLARTARKLEERSARRNFYGSFDCFRRCSTVPEGVEEVLGPKGDEDSGGEGEEVEEGGRS